MAGPCIPSKCSVAFSLYPCAFCTPIESRIWRPTVESQALPHSSPLIFLSDLRYSPLARPIFFQSHPAPHPVLPPTMSCFFCHQPPSWLVFPSDLPSSILTGPPPSWSCSPHENMKPFPVALSVTLTATRIESSLPPAFTPATPDFLLFPAQPLRLPHFIK